MKRIIVKMTLELPVEFDDNMPDETIDFIFNDGSSSCLNNYLPHGAAFAGEKNMCACICCTDIEWRYATDEEKEYFKEETNEHS